MAPIHRSRPQILLATVGSLIAAVLATMATPILLPLRPASAVVVSVLLFPVTWTLLIGYFFLAQTLRGVVYRLTAVVTAFAALIAGHWWI